MGAGTTPSPDASLGDPDTSGQRASQIKKPSSSVLLFVAGIFMLASVAWAGPVSDLTPLLAAHPEKFGRLLADPQPYRLQILISEVVTNADGRPALNRYVYRVGAEYFYPASAIKLCAAVAALQTIEELQAAHHSPDLLQTPLTIAPEFAGDTVQTNDSSNLAGGHITIGHELRKMALVSDNQAFNRFFDLVGHQRLNDNLHALGLASVVINHRLADSRALPDTCASAAVTFYPPGMEPMVVPARVSGLMFTNHARGLRVGRGFIKDGQLINQPMDFTTGNGISLMDLQDLLIKLTRPDIGLGTPPLKLAATHRAWLLRAMTEYPHESTNPVYADPEFTDDCCKMLLPGIRRVFPASAPGERVEITAKLGQAYGFSIENSYVQNPKNGRSVFVSGVIYTNAREILNSDQYEYATVALPFYADLGELVARRWLGETAH